MTPLGMPRPLALRPRFIADGARVPMNMLAGD
jgi:hypothetical protein